MPMFKLKNIYCSLAIIMLSPAAMASIEFLPSPQNTQSKLGVYGVNVASDTGLKAIIPEDWELVLHKDVNLPPTLSWTPRDTWTDVLSKVANTNDLHVIVNYSSKTVSLQPALNVHTATKKRASQPATPLPSFQSQSQAGAAGYVNTSQMVSSTLTPKGENITTTTTVTTTITPSTPVSEGYKTVNSDSFSYQAPIAFNKPVVRTIAQGIANKYGYRLVWLVPEGEVLKGPITLMGQSGVEDVKLLAKALGHFSPIKVAIKGQDLVVASADRIQVYEAVGYDSMFATTSFGQGPHTTHTEGKDRKVAENQEEAAKAITVEAAPTMMELNVPANTPLEDQIAQFLRANGYTLEWKVEGGFNAKRDMTFKGQNLKEVLSAVLPKLGLSADINTRDKHIVVRPGDPILDR